MADRTLSPTYADVVVVRLDSGVGAFVTTRRVVGLPGDTVACPAATDGSCHAWVRNGTPLVETYAHGDDGTVYAATTLGPGRRWLLGDHRDAAFDSRQVGPASAADVIGVAVEVRSATGTRPVSGAPLHERPEPGATLDLDPTGIPTAQAVPVEPDEPVGGRPGG